MTETVRLPSSSSAERASGTVARDGASDFDFLHGRWRVHNRRRRRPLATSSGWEEFEAHSVVRPVWHGRGNIEEWEATTDAGIVRAVSLHLYDAAAGQWRLHWATERVGRVGIATVGAFQHGLGEFIAHEDIDGRAALLRITWENLGVDACRWEQSVSHDGGGSWTSDWTMEFSRER
ncbi:MAG TPA: hypothetical protein VGP25_02330 [Gemmatimonadaceae bacterium]|nr:hypothetical protein [Gemmatimonadaceae bacterium]